LRQGRPSLAEALLLPLAEHPHPGIQKLWARLELSTGRQEAARVRLERIAQAQPLDWEWPPLLAAALTPSMHQTAPATLFDLYQQGLGRQPRQPEALANRARLRLVLGDVPGAEADSNAALAQKPWFDAPLLLWVERAVAARDFARAEQILDAARKRLDTPRRAGAALDLMRLKGAKSSELVSVAGEVLRQWPDRPEALRAVGAALQAARKPDRAAQVYAQILAQAPDDAATRNNLALLYRDRGDLEEAMATWRVALPTANDTVRLNYALVLQQRGDSIEAETLLREVLNRQPRHPVALRGLAEVDYAAGDDEGAWRHAEQSLRIDPRHPLAWKTAAGIARRREGEAAAIRLLEQGTQQAQPVLPLRQALFQRWRSILSQDELRRRVAVWCAEAPQEVEYWLMAADAAHDANDFDACEAALQEAYRRDPSPGGTALVRFYEGRERLGAARRVAEQLVRSDPDAMRHWGFLAEVNYRQERLDESLAALDGGLKREPTRLALVRQKVGILLARERFDAAIATARALAEAEPLPPQVGLWVEALHRAFRFDEAVTVVADRLASAPGDRVWRLRYADALRRAGRYAEALAVLRALYADEPGNFNVVRQLVKALMVDEALPEALAVMQDLADRVGDRPDMLDGIAAVLIEQGALAEAKALLDQALARFPQHLGLWRLKARVARRAEDEAEERALYQGLLARFPARRWAGFAIPELVRLELVTPMEDALNAWRQAESASANPWWAAYRAAKELKRDGRAMELLAKIEARRGPQAEVFSARAAILQEGWRLREAAAEVREALALRPDSVSYYEQLLNILVKAGDFDSFDTLMAKLEHLLGDRRYAQFQNFFFNINCHPTWSMATIGRFYRDWYERAVKPGLPPFKPHPNRPDPQRRLKIGYVSPDFRRHAVAYFSEPLLIAHDREQFELYAFAHLEPKAQDAYSERFKGYVHHWIEIRGMSNDELERRIREEEIDILIDLAGHTSNNRLSVFLRRPAPVQASWIFGAGQTTGLPEVDYLLADASIVPPELESFCAEQVLRLPFPGLPMQPAHDVLDPVPLPCRERGFVTFGVLARPLRTNRQTVALWAEILRRVPTGVLRFDHVPYAEADIQQRLIGYFAEHGIGPERLVFRNTRPHWQAYRDIDLQLDPFPAGSGTTGTEGLFMERLVVTLHSRPPMGRAVSGALAALGLEDDCVALTPEEYVDKAVALAQNPARLIERSAGLRATMQGSWLMDYGAYGRETAKLYRRMWCDWCARMG